MKKTYITLLMLLMISFAMPAAFAKMVQVKNVLPEVTLNFTTNLHSHDRLSDFSVGVFIDEAGMSDPNEGASFGMLDHEQVYTRLHGENDGPMSGENQSPISTAYIDIYHDSQTFDSQFCILEVNLDANTSKLLSVHWIRHWTYDPQVPGIKPAVCSYNISGQTINVNITNQE